MTTVSHQVTLASQEQYHGRLPSRAIGQFLTDLPVAIRGAVAMALRSRSTSPGRQPGWLDRAADIRFVDHQGNGATTLTFEAPTIGEAAEEIYSQGELFATRPDPKDTAFDVFGRVLLEIERKNEDSDYYDRQLLNKVIRFKKVLDGTFQEAGFSGRDFGTMRPRITSGVIESAQRLACTTPEPSRVRVFGTLDMVRASNRTFGLVLTDGQEVRGSFADGSVEELASFLNQPVLIVGAAVFRPSGRLLRIDVESCRLAADSDRFFSAMPQPRGVLNIRDIVRKQQFNGGVGAIFGQWPGDETDEEMELALAEIS